MLIAGRQSFGGITSNLPKSLKIWLNGKDNGGRGIHLQSSDSWVNLADNGHSFVRSSNTTQFSSNWESDCALFTDRTQRQSFICSNWSMDFLGASYTFIVKCMPQSGYFSNYSGIFGCHPNGIVGFQYENGVCGCALFNEGILDVGASIRVPADRLSLDEVHILAYTESPTSISIYVDDSFYETKSFEECDTRIINPIIVGRGATTTSPNIGDNREFVGKIYDFKAFNECFDYGMVRKLMETAKD